MKEVDVVTESVIQCPLEKVASWAGDPDNAPRWYQNIESVEWETEPPIGIGSRLAFVAHFLGRRLAYTYEIVELVPGTRLVMRTSEGPFPMETTYEWTPEGKDSTRMTLRNRGRPAGFSAFLTPVMEFMMSRANRADLRRLKSILEAAC